jgi:hypothetical protein
MTVTILATFEPDPVVEYACQVCGERFIGSLVEPSTTTRMSRLMRAVPIQAAITCSTCDQRVRK